MPTTSSTAKAATKQGPCTICHQQSSSWCSRCKSAHYCSVKCQKADLPLHKLLCAEMSTFLATNPRPAETALKSHTLALYFPDSPDPEHPRNPQLVWVENMLYLLDNGDVEDVGVNINGYIRVHGGCTYVSGDDHKLEIYMDDNAFGDYKSNEGIGKLTHGYKNTDSRRFLLFASRWHGPIIVLRTKPIKKCQSSSDKKYEDITLADLRLATHYFASEFRFFESETTNKFVVRDPRWWTKGVKISCAGDMEILGQKQYRDVWVRRDTRRGEDQDMRSLQETFSNIMSGTMMGISKLQKSEACTISEHMGFTLLVSTCEVENAVKEVLQADKSKHPVDVFDNPESNALMIDANPIKGNTAWGLSNYRGWHTGPKFTVLVVRKDEKPVSAKQLELFVAYCKDVLKPEMRRVPNPKVSGDEDVDMVGGKVEKDTIPHDPTDERWRKKFIEEYMKSSKFEEFIEEFKKKKLAEGDATWSDVASPRDG